MRFFQAAIRILSIVVLLHGLAESQNPDEFCFDKDTCCDGQPSAHSLGDWNNCNIYYLCFETPYEYTCLPDLPLYDPLTDRCVAEGTLDECIDGTRAPIINTTDSTVSTTITSVGPTEQSSLPTTTESVDNGNCTEDGVYYVPYPGDCSKYMICANYILLPDVQQCPPGTRFDTVLKECNLETLVECLPTCPDAGVAYIPHETNCSMYWLCTLGSPTLRACPPMLLFDSKVSACNSEDLVFCPNLCPPEEPNVNLPHTKNCDQYWLCIFGDPTLKTCPDGLLFDPEYGQCNTADQVVCGPINFSKL